MIVLAVTAGLGRLAGSAYTVIGWAVIVEGAGWSGVRSFGQRSMIYAFRAYTAPK